MKLFLVKTNKMYDSLDELPIQKVQKVSKRSKKQLLIQFDHAYEFFYKGQQFPAKDVQNLIESHHESTSLIIVNQKSSIHQSKQKASYQSHRETIQKYINETKINQKEKIRQNAEFIFQNAIDGNFKYHTFEYFQLEKQFTEKRKAELLDQVFWKLCESQDDEISLAEGKKNHLENEESKSEQKVEVKDKSPPHHSSNVSEQKQQKVKLSKTQQQSHRVSQQQKIPQQSSHQILQLHELEYINQNWKQLLCINKHLLKTNLDNIKYYEQLPQRRNFSQKDDVEKMEIENRQQKSDKKPNYDNDIQI